MGPAPVAIIMGSQSDWATMRHAAETLDPLGVAYDARIVSAHRTPDRLVDFAKGAKAAGFQVIIAGAGGAAHLPGMTAAADAACRSSGVPVESKALSGQDSLLSIVQMPAGIPVGTLAIGRAGRRQCRPARRAVLALHDDGSRRAARRLARRGRRDSVAERPTDEALKSDAPRPAPPSASSAAASSAACWPSRPPSLGSRCHVFAPDADSPAFDVAAAHTVAAYDDEAALPRFARSRPGRHLRIRERARRRPPRSWPRMRLWPRTPALSTTTQDRLAEKTFLAGLGIADRALRRRRERGRTPRGARPRSAGPAVLKTRRFGYDGKGQIMIRAGVDAGAACEELGAHPVHPRGLRALRARGFGRRGARTPTAPSRPTTSARTSTRRISST